MYSRYQFPSMDKLAEMVSNVVEHFGYVSCAFTIWEFYSFHVKYCEITVVCSLKIYRAEVLEAKWQIPECDNITKQD